VWSSLQTIIQISLQWGHVVDTATHTVRQPNDESWAVFMWAPWKIERAPSDTASLVVRSTENLLEVHRRSSISLQRVAVWSKSRGQSRFTTINLRSVTYPPIPRTQRQDGPLTDDTHSSWVGATSCWSEDHTRRSTNHRRCDVCCQPRKTTLVRQIK